MKGIVKGEHFFWFSKIWAQLVLLGVLPPVTGLIVGNAMTSSEILKVTNNDFFLRAIYESFTNKGIASFIIVVIITFITIFIFLRNLNKDSLLNDGQNIYIHNQYIRLWIASKILGYGKLCLIGVSLPLQFRLILNGTFKDYVSERSTTNYVMFSGEVNVDESNVNEINDEKNPLVLLICDTYEIDTAMIGDHYKNYPIVKIISSCLNDGIRYDNPKLVNEVRKVTHKYVLEYPNIIVLATMNPKNSIKIIGDSFSQADRNGYNKISVIQMNDNKEYVEEYIVFEK